jgi:F420H(2)-dependent quinone reductase
MNPIMKVMAKVHTFILQMSGGRIGNQMGGQKILLLHHVGAKSGKKYATPVGFVQERNVYVIVAAAAGQPHHPGWYYNLQKNPDTTIEIMGKPIKVKAEVTLKEQRDLIWAVLSARFPQFDQFQQKTAREIPVVLLHPQNS